MRVYLDNAAGTRVSDSVVKAMLPYFSERYGNASSTHGEGVLARSAVENARDIIGNCIGVDVERIVFTSGATEANNAALNHYAMEGELLDRKHIVVSAIEHPSVLRFCEYLKEHRGFDVSLIYPDENGIVLSDAVKRSIRSDTCFVSVMAVNNEVGAIQPFDEIYRVCKSCGVAYHCDATQALPYMHRIYGMEDASFSFSGHKFYGPKGVGFLILPAGTVGFHKLLYGGDQEWGMRAGTENVAGIVGMATAFEEAHTVGISNRLINDMRNSLYLGLIEKVGGVVLNGNLALSTPYILNVSFDGINGEDLVSMLSDLYGICCSTGSACKSGDSEPSHVLKAMGISAERAAGSVRFSLSRYTTQEEIDYTIASVSECVGTLRAFHNNC